MSTIICPRILHEQIAGEVNLLRKRNSDYKMGSTIKKVSVTSRTQQLQGLDWL